jgi:glycosyltransferase involved in cell wall biosynthesis
MNPERILYLSHYYPVEIVNSRALSTRNIAGNNRIRRITGALANAGLRVDIVSPGICMQCGLGRRIFQGVYKGREDGVDVTVAPAVVFPFVGGILEILLFPFWTVSFLFRTRFDGAVFYNYSISFAILAIFLRVIRVPFIMQVEDVAVPARADWRAGSETRPVQQLVMWLCMRTIAGLSAGLWVPSERFRPFLPERKPCLVVAGCVADSEWGQYSPIQLQAPVRVLFVGKYEREHGVDLLIGALRRLRAGGPTGAHFLVDCCGTDTYPAELLAMSAAEGTPVIQLHGLLSDSEYRGLLAESAVTLTLQRAQGRHANLKSPSKAQEFLAAGKLVIATDVGDLASHSGDHLIMLRHETVEELVGVFEDIAEEPGKYEKIAQTARSFSLRESSYEAVGKKLIVFLSQVFRERSSRPLSQRGV